MSCPMVWTGRRSVPGAKGCLSKSFVRIFMMEPESADFGLAGAFNAEKCLIR